MRFQFKLKNNAQISVYEGVRIEEDRLAGLNRYLRRLFGVSNERKKADFTYNCHGFTFISKLGWIGCEDVFKTPRLFIPGESLEIDESDIDFIENIVRGNGYRFVCRLNNIEVDTLEDDRDIREGDMVIYKAMRRMKEQICHSGIIIKLCKINNRLTDVVVLSKMGYGGEYFHPLKKIPEIFGAKIAEIWTDRS